MSFEASNSAWERKGLVASEKLVLLALADYHNIKTGQCNPSAASIGYKTGLSAKSVYRAITRLEELNCFTVVHSKRGNNYSFDVEAKKPPENNKKETKAKKIKQTDKLVLMQFDEFWKAYPRKVNKNGALTAWKSIKPTSEECLIIFADLIHKIESKTWRLEESQYIPHASTYLNQRRWTDLNEPRPEVKPTSTLIT